MSSISSFCRTCMANVIDNTGGAVNSCNIFETEGLADKLVLCSSIEIQPYDEYPPRVCNKCYIKIHVFCGFQEMCRESLEMFSKMLEKQTKTGSYVPKILGGNVSVGVSKDRLSNTRDIESDSKTDFSNHEMMFGYHSFDRPYDLDETASNDPLTGTEDCVLVEAISIAKREAMENIINRDHDYSEAAVVWSVIGGEEDSDPYHLAEKTSICLPPRSTRLNLKMLRNVSPDDDNRNKDGSSKAHANCVSNEYINDSFSEIPIAASYTNGKITPSNKIIKENTLHDKISSKNDKKQIFGCFADGRKLNKTQLKVVGFENKEECIFKYLSGDNESNQTQLTNVHHENEEGCTFEKLSNIEEDGKKRLAHVPQEESNEIYSNSDTVIFDTKSKTGKILSCDICPQTFIFEHRLNAHKRRHDGLKGYPCPHDNCTRAYNRLIALRQHVNDHNGIPRQIYKCEFNNCGLEFIHKTGLRYHLRKTHKHGPSLPVGKYVCETCGKIYQNTRVFKAHQYIHIDESLWPFKCDIEGCSKSFRSEKFYKIHKNRHLGIKPFACMYCEKRFSSHPNLYAHVNFHTLEKKWSCSFCPHVCYTPANLRQHIRNIHENNPGTKKVPCRFCNKILASYTSRKNHEVRHTGEKPFVCDECGRRYAQLCLLKRHKQTHMPAETIKKFYCGVCNRAFTRTIDLKKHEMTHTGEKPFECDTCGVKFRYRWNLKRHETHTLCGKSRTTTMIDKDTIEDCTGMPIID